jgi:hypothetical protein
MLETPTGSVDWIKVSSSPPREGHADLFIIVDPLAFIHVNLGELGARFKADTLPQTLYT